MTIYEARAVSALPGFQRREIQIQQLFRERSDSLPEARNFRRIRREIDLDSDLDVHSRDENVFLRSTEAKQWKAKRVTHKQLERAKQGPDGEVVVISTEPLGSPSPERDLTNSPTALTHVPWTNWTRWNYKRSKFCIV